MLHEIDYSLSQPIREYSVIRLEGREAQNAVMLQGIIERLQALVTLVRAAEKGSCLLQ